jgi:hypothetical protein
MLKAEIGVEIDDTISSGDNTRYNRIINNQQLWLGSQHVFLVGKCRVEVALAAGTRYYSIPESTIDIDRMEKQQWVKLANGIRYPVKFGIGQQQYSAYNSETTEFDPVRRFDFVDQSGTRKLEVWPLPQSVQTLLLSGTLPITAMSSDSATCVIDDLLLVLFSAAEILARDKAADAQAKLAKAQALLMSLRGSQQSKFEMFKVSGGGLCGQGSGERRATVGISGQDVLGAGDGGVLGAGGAGSQSWD